MAVGMLRDDLLSAPGVERAQLDGDPMAPTGVRVHLAAGVDASVVGNEVQRVLSLHGLRSEVSEGATVPASLRRCFSPAFDQAVVSAVAT